MIYIKNKSEFSLMKEAGRVTGNALAAAREIIAPGITTLQIDRVINKYIKSCSAIPSFLGYSGFPASACISVNDEVIHGIPSNRKLEEGDIVKIDVGAYKNGFHGDSAATFPVGNIAPEAKQLIEATRQSFFEAVKNAVHGLHINDISSTVENYVKKFGYSVVTDYVGHGVGKSLHEDPGVPNYDMGRRGLKILNGMTLAIEPMVNIGSPEIKVLKDGWTVKTSDGGLSAHYEHTVAVTSEGPIFLTEPDCGFM